LVLFEQIENACVEMLLPLAVAVTDVVGGKDSQIKLQRFFREAGCRYRRFNGGQDVKLARGPGEGGREDD
jgi:hypothetical protein